MTKEYKPDAIYRGRFYRHCDVRLSNYERAKEMYEKVKPLGGGRKKHNIDLRPLTDRYRYWETLLKDGDSYGFGFTQSYPMYGSSTPGMTRPIIGYHHEEKPVLMVEPDGSMVFTPTYMSSYATWDLIGAILPEELTFVKFSSKQYIRALQEDGGYKYYHIPKSMKGKFLFTPRKTEKGGRVFDVHGADPEVKYVVDRALANTVREKFAKFMDYYDYMHKVVDTEDILKSPTSWIYKHQAITFFRDHDWLGLRWDKADEFPPQWGDAVKYMMVMNTQVSWPHQTPNGGYEVTIKPPEAIRHIYKGGALYEITRPYKAIQVELGVPFRRNGREI